MSQRTREDLQQLDAQVDLLLQHFGEVLQTRRKAVNHTLEDIHQRLGMDGANLSHFENGKERAKKGKKPGSMTLRNFLRLKLYYDVAWQQLLGPLPASTAERIITRTLQSPPKVQESFLFLLEYGLGEDFPADDRGTPTACLTTSSSSA